jgi:GGDEF domain-containing protein
MISIRESISELEKSEQLRSLAQDCYLSAIQNLVQYAIELEEGITTSYRNHLAALAREVETGTPQAISETRASLRGLLRDYRDRASTYLNGLREELSHSANGLQRLIENLTENDGDHETRLRRALGTLRELAENSAAGKLGPTLGATADAIEQAITQFREQHQLTVSQFLAEIHLLHKRIDALESAVSADDLTKLFNRSDMENRIRSAHTGGSLLLLRVQGFERAAVQFSRDVAQQLAGAFVKRLRKNLLPEAILGCWSKEEFLVVHPAPRNEAQIAAKWVAQHLSGAYACLQGGKTVRPTIQVGVSVLDFSPGKGAERTLEEISRFFTK